MHWRHQPLYKFQLKKIVVTQQRIVGAENEITEFETISKYIDCCWRDKKIYCTVATT